METHAYTSSATRDGPPTHHLACRPMGMQSKKIQEVDQSTNIPLFFAAVGSFEELPAYIIVVAFEQVQPMPWHAWSFTRDPAADD